MGCFLTNSSLGRKLVMSISGCFLVLFILFHMSMNIAAIFSADAYNWICAMLGANWYALVATAILAGGVLIHFVYAFWLTWQNRKARGNVRYAVTVTEKGVDWASKNMLLLGVIVILGLFVKKTPKSIVISQTIRTFVFVCMRVYTQFVPLKSADERS